MRLISVSSTGGVNRPGPVPAFLRSPPLIPAPLDMKPFLQFPLESPHPASIGLFHNFNAVSARGGRRLAYRRTAIVQQKIYAVQFKAMTSVYFFFFFLLSGNDFQQGGRTPAWRFCCNEMSCS